MSVAEAAAPGLIVAAPSSGSGKTVFTLGLIRHWARAGVAVASAKVGPDYIDPAFHAAASGRPSLNLDPWAMRASTLAAAVSALSRDAEVVVCEGVMGLFDGATVRQGSTADLAESTGWPVVLIIDAHAQAASAAAVVRGFATHRPGLSVVAAIFNRVGGERHAGLLREACELDVPDVPVLGCLPHAEGLVLPERHLGLVQAREHPDIDAFLDRAAELVGTHVDTGWLLRLARPARLAEAEPRPSSPVPPLGQRIAVADDAAFAFRYPMVVEGWRESGCDISFFSPLADEAPPVDADGVYLPGGYPELHAGVLASNARFLRGLRAAAGWGAVIFGECGGYMVMGDGILDAQGRRHAMAGLLPLETSFADRQLHLGYREASLVRSCPLGAGGGRFRGHEFHYAKVLREDAAEPLFECRDAIGRRLGATGSTRGRVMGSFVHLIDSVG